MHMNLHIFVRNGRIGGGTAIIILKMSDATVKKLGAQNLCTSDISKPKCIIIRSLVIHEKLSHSNWSKINTTLPYNTCSKPEPLIS